MKAIIIRDDEKTIEALKSAIKKAEGRATARKISFYNIVCNLDSVTSKLNITKKAMEGIKVFCDPNAQEFPRAYKYVPESTQFIAVYKNGSWRVTDIYRGICGRKKIRVELTDKAKESILAQYETMY